MATLCGGTVFLQEGSDTKLEDVTAGDFGFVGEAIISKDDTLFLNGKGDPNSVADRVDSIREAIDETNSDYEKEKLQERLAKLAGGIGVLKVGGASELEVSEKKDRFTDALNATRAAVEEGIVPGGGTALLRSLAVLDSLETENFDQQCGVDIIKAAITAPARQIATNAGVDGAVVVDKVLASDDPSFGYNARAEKYEDLLSAGIVDPTKVVRTALEDASGVASLLTTIESIVVEEPKDDAAPMMPPGGMGGM